MINYSCCAEVSQAGHFEEEDKNIARGGRQMRNTGGYVTSSELLDLNYHQTLKSCNTRITVSAIVCMGIEFKLLLLFK